MRLIEDCMDMGELLELKPRKMAEFCEGVLDTEMLIQELEEYGPFAPLRKTFCEFLGVGESTLTGWLKEQRVPRLAKVAYVLLVAFGELQVEVRRLRKDAAALKIVQDGEKYHLVLFKADDTGITIGRIVARDIADVKIARVLAGSVKAFNMLQESRGAILEMMERDLNAEHMEELRELDSRIQRETLAAFDPDKWRDLFGPLDLDELMEEVPREYEGESADLEISPGEGSEKVDTDPVSVTKSVS